MKLAVGGSKGKDINVKKEEKGKKKYFSYHNAFLEAQRKLWKEQLAEARDKKAKQNRWYYTTRHDQNEPIAEAEPLPVVKNPAVNAFNKKSLNKDFSTENFNKGNIKLDSYSNGGSKSNVNKKKEAISERELNLLQVKLL